MINSLVLSLLATSATAVLRVWQPGTDIGAMFDKYDAGLILYYDTSTQETSLKGAFE